MPSARIAIPTRIRQSARPTAVGTLELLLALTSSGVGGESTTLRDEHGKALTSLFDGITETPAQIARYQLQRQWWAYNAEKAARLEKFPYASPLAACSAQADATQAGGPSISTGNASPQFSCPGHAEPYQCSSGDQCDPELCWGGGEQDCSEHAASCLCFVVQYNCSK